LTAGRSSGAAAAKPEKDRTMAADFSHEFGFWLFAVDAATTALLKDHLVETFTRGLHGNIASLKSIDLEYVGNDIGVGAGR
jgi:hypothetical protein